MTRTIQEARDHEKAKTPVEKGKDVAYTINHAIMCLSSDALDPEIGNYIQSKLGKDVSLRGLINLITRGEADKQIGDGSKGNRLAWWASEIVGDAGAVPVAILMQRMFPGFMQGIQRFMEPPLSGVFRKAAHAQALHWGEKEGLAVDDPKVKHKENELYQYEVDHLPQAFMWTASSIAMNLTAQKLWFNKKATIPVILVAKGLGTVTTATTLITARGFFPKQMHKSDAWVSQHIATPISSAVGSLFGLNKDSKKTASQEELAHQIREQSQEISR